MKQHKALCLIALWLIMGSLLLAQNPRAIRLSARVVGGGGEALEGVSIYDGKKAVFSDEAGLFAISTAADSLYFSRLGYESLALSVFSLPQKVVMQARPLQLSIVRVQADHSGAISRMHHSLRIEAEEEKNLRDGSELLLSQPSVSTQSLPLRGEYQNLSLLGNLARHTLVMIDGIAQSSAGEAFDFSKIPASQISRIEIIEGASSALGGSSAIGGIINIITHKPLYRNVVEIEEGIGSYGLHSRRYHVGQHLGILQLNLEHAHFDADNDFEYNPSWAPGESYKRVNNRKIQDAYLIKAVVQPKDQELQAHFGQTMDVRELPGPVNFPALYDSARQLVRSNQAYLRHSYLGKSVENELTLWHNRANSVYDNRHSSNQVARSHNRQSTKESGINETFSFKKDEFSYEIGGEIKGLDYRMDNLLSANRNEASVLSTAVFARLGQDFELGAWQGANRLALRRDNSRQESFDSWRIEHRSKLWLPLEVEFGANLGTSFSIPSLYDRYWIGDSFTQGNAELRSESGFGYKLFLKLSRPWVSLTADMHHNEINDLIQWRQVYLFGPIWKPFNIGKVRIRNQHLGVQVFPERNFGADMGITFTQSTDFSINQAGMPSATHGKALPYTPEYTANLMLRYSAELHGATISYKHSGRQYTTADNLIDSLPETGVLDAATHYIFRLKALDIRLDAKLNNILDKSYESYAHVPKPGRNFSLNLALKRMW